MHSNLTAVQFVWCYLQLNKYNCLKWFPCTTSERICDVLRPFTKLKRAGKPSDITCLYFGFTSLNSLCPTSYLTTNVSKIEDLETFYQKVISSKFHSHNRRYKRPYYVIQFHTDTCIFTKSI